MRRRLATLSAVLLSLGFCAPPAAADYKDACGVAVDSQGNVYVSDYYHNSIDIFDPEDDKEDPNDGFAATIFKVDPPPPMGNPLDAPCDLAVDSTGNLYVNNYHKDIVRFVPSLFPPKNEVTTYSRDIAIDSNHPTSVAVDLATDRIYVDARTYIAVYEPSGAPVFSGGEPLRFGLGSLGDGYGVAASSFPATEGWVYVADAADNTVKVYDPLVDPLVPIRTIDGAGTPLGGLHLADADLAIDPSDGYLYVTDNLQPGFEHPELAIEKFSVLGYYRGRLRLPGTTEGEGTGMVNAGPSSVAIDGDKIYVTSGNYEEAELLVFGLTPQVATQILGVERSGSGSGMVTSIPAGLRCGAACKGEFDQDSTVVLVPDPAPHSRFVGWSGCTSELGESCGAEMSTARSVTAEFEPIPQRSLTVAKTGAGTGAVTSAPAGIDCGDDCEGDFDEAGTVMLTATAAGGSRFASWSGCDAEPTPNTCAVTMSAARSVTANFEPPPPPPPPSNPAQRTLAISSTGIGTATGSVVSEPAGIDCGRVCAHIYREGTPITLVAHPARGSRFLGWGGCDGASGDRCTLTLGKDKTVVAAFGPGSPGRLRLRNLDVRGAIATLKIEVPVAGTLTASGRGLRPASKLPLARGPIALRLRLSPVGLRAFRKARDRRLDVKVTLTLAPFDGGDTVRIARTMAFVRRST